MWALRAGHNARPPSVESIVEYVAGVEDYQVALAAFRAACERWPGTPITLRQGARELSRTAGFRGIREELAAGVRQF